MASRSQHPKVHAVFALILIIHKELRPFIKLLSLFATTYPWIQPEMEFGSNSFYGKLQKIIWPRGYKTLFMLNWTEHEIFHAINLKLLTMPNYFLLNIADMKIYLLINMKMPYLLAEKISCSAELSMKKRT